LHIVIEYTVYTCSTSIAVLLSAVLVHSVPVVQLYAPCRARARLGTLELVPMPGIHSTAAAGTEAGGAPHRRPHSPWQTGRWTRTWKKMRTKW
jgi:hypothetical protein